MLRRFLRTRVPKRRAALGSAAGLLILLPLVTACGGEENGRAVGVPTPTPSTTTTSTLLPAATGTQAPTASPPAPYRPDSPDIAPPLAVLSSRAGTQEAALGTYCWEEEGQGLCADYSGLPVPESTLVVEMGKQVTVRVPGIDQLVNVSVELYDRSLAQVESGGTIIVYPPQGATTIPFQHDGPTVTLTADIEPGEYVVSVFVGFPTEGFAPSGPNAAASTVRGDAVYGFHIDVVVNKP